MTKKELYKKYYNKPVIYYNGNMITPKEFIRIKNLYTQATFYTVFTMIFIYCYIGKLLLG